MGNFSKLMKDLVYRLKDPSNSNGAKQVHTHITVEIQNIESIWETLKKYTRRKREIINKRIQIVVIYH